jgi:hypothetical protein
MNYLTKIKKGLIFISLISASSTAFARDDITTIVSGWGVTLLVLLPTIMLIVAFAGIILIIGAGISWWMLATDRAPQRVKEVGMKGVFIGFGLGAAALMLGYFINIIVNSTTASGEIENSEIDTILGFNSQPSYEQRFVPSTQRTTFV